MLTLRPYQQAAIDAVYHYLRTQNGNPCIVAPTGSGKSPMMSTIARDAVTKWNGRVLILAHVKELLEQTANTLRRIAPDLPIGVYSAGLNSRDTNEPVIVAGIQSVYKRACELDRFDLIIVDECFPAGTLISTPRGEMPIEDIYIGQSIYNAMGTGTVEAISMRTVHELIQIRFDNGTIITCTPNHPFFTESGWKQAASLERGSCLFRREDLRMLRESVLSTDKKRFNRQGLKVHEGISLEKAEILFDFLLQEAGKCHVRPTNCRKNANFTASECEKTIATRREWQNIGSSKALDRIIGDWLDFGIRDSNNERATHGGGSEILQSGLGITDGTTCHRIGREHSPNAENQGCRQTKNAAFGGVRVECVTHLELQSPVTVFNLQVDQHPTYFANGVLVHNCHLLPPDGEGMYQTFLQDARVVNPHVRLIGLTATPYRLKSGMLCGPDNLLHDICFEIGVKQLIEENYLCPLKTKAGRSKADCSNLKIRAGEFISSEVEELMDTDELVLSACREIIMQTTDRHSVLIFAASVAHAEHVKKAIEKYSGVECGLVTGDTPSSEREFLLKRFKGEKIEKNLFGDTMSQLKFLVNVNVLTTGFDAPNVDCVVLLRPTASPGLYYQMCLDMETEVLTPSGWRRCHEIATGDFVGAFDLATEEIVYVHAADKVHRALRRNESMYGIENSRLDIRVTNNHNMILRCKGITCKNWQVQSAEQAADRCNGYHIPIAGNGRQYVQEANLTDAEIAFLGWYLTDGYKNHCNGTITISQSLKKYHDEIRNILTMCGFGFHEYRQSRTGGLSRYDDNIMFVIPHGIPRGEQHDKTGWVHLEDWIDKDVPYIYNALSKRQFRILLEAMNQGNGRRHDLTKLDYTPKTMTISLGCRQRLADRIQQLAIERGFRCEVRHVLPTPSEWNQSPQEQWSIAVRDINTSFIGGTRKDKNKLVPNRCHFGKVSFHTNEWVWCLTTEKGTLVTRRNGKVAIVGNCGRGFRINESKTDCLVLDYGGNILRHGPVDAIRIKDANSNCGGDAPVKECPECLAIVHAAIKNCPECGFNFPEPEKSKHDDRASNEGILTGQVIDTEFDVLDVVYSVHTKRGADENTPKTFRVDYFTSLRDYQSEWLCPEHSGWARKKFEKWWLEHSSDPLPETAQEAVDIANGGGVASTKKITVRKVTGEQFDKIIRYELDDIPESVAADLKKLDAWGDPLPVDDIPF